MSVIFSVGNLPNNFAPNTPPALTPSAVGTSTEKSYKPRQAYKMNENKDIGKITKIAVACATFSS